jgi:wyosine [tRNA(Phe)-imidazoG37] synthetase (radical SAM superfamily)
MSQAVSLSSRVRIPEGILSNLLEDELVLLNLSTGVYFSLDAVGTRIWQLVKAHQSRPLETVLDSLMKEYDVETARCAQDLLHLVLRLQENSLLEISN